MPFVVALQNILQQFVIKSSVLLGSKSWTSINSIVATVSARRILDYVKGSNPFNSLFRIPEFVIILN